MASDEKLCLREFPKSLKGTTFTWYDNLKAESIDSWMTMISLFLGKFYSDKRKITLIDLSKNGHRTDEEVEKYITRFRRLTLDFREDVSEEELVEIYVRGMVQSFKGSLINLRFQNFVELEEASERIANCIEELSANPNWRYTVSTTSAIPYNPRPNINESVNRQQMSDPPQKRSRWARKDSRPPPSPLPYGREQTIGLLNQWVARGEVQLPPTVVDNNKMNKDALRYCHYHRRMGHPTIECLAIRSIFERKRESGEFETTRKMIESDSFPRH
ncbi:uncharacterized protein LOC113359851 [Papaver somniferum]|uniref:uncharacterized protein LOC113359851 n=1 Tax=Papaver somniferum TaxID=3469 RepID=UPI000E703A32|nr:uncharacterized protein LOC113359851 [Papaver somniferum]